MVVETSDPPVCTLAKLPPLVAPVRSRPDDGSVVLVERMLPTLSLLQQGAMPRGKAPPSGRAFLQRDAESPAGSAGCRWSQA